MRPSGVADQRNEHETGDNEPAGEPLKAREQQNQSDQADRHQQV